ncbi:hypothetical protein FCM35_KLT20128 [Carex littledalei]|uniref:Uncharacterized protein n=1 Tax=Carex littledalei TaxID=544730 RepID=A0A833VE90_9POAL|nr:hypothetical protein FCM35_KLT20128 [Carex littledalei]
MSRWWIGSLTRQMKTEAVFLSPNIFAYCVWRLPYLIFYFSPIVSPVLLSALDMHVYLWLNSMFLLGRFSSFIKRGVDALKKGMAYVKEAKEALINIFGDKFLKWVVYGIDLYNCLLADVYVGKLCSGKDFGFWLNPNPHSPCMGLQVIEGEKNVTI